jgi:hypothetical protein
MKDETSRSNDRATQNFAAHGERFEEFADSEMLHYAFAQGLRHVMTSKKPPFLVQVWGTFILGKNKDRQHDFSSSSRHPSYALKNCCWQLQRTDSLALLRSYADSNPTRIRKRIGDNLKFLAIQANVLVGTIA